MWNIAESQTNGRSVGTHDRVRPSHRLQTGLPVRFGTLRRPFDRLPPA